MDDEDSILPRKLQVALEHILEQRNDLALDQEDGPPDCKHGKRSATPQTASPSSVVSQGTRGQWPSIPLDIGLGRKADKEAHLSRSHFNSELWGKAFPPPPFWP